MRPGTPMETLPAARLQLPLRYQRLGETLSGRDERIGRGTFARVYSGFDVLTQTPVAVKRQACNTDAAARELAAYETLRAFEHKHILRMIDRFVEPSADGPMLLYLVFEFISTDLWRVYQTPLGRRGLIPEQLVMQYLRGIALGVGHLHSVGVVHGDLAMSNILITAGHEAKVGDLGTAHSAHSMLYDSPMTTSYVRAPEIWAGSPTCGYPADSWGVGVIAFSLLSKDSHFLRGVFDGDADEAYVIHTIFS